MKKLLLLIVTAFFGFSAFSQNEGEITGRLTDSTTLEPIPFAYMTLKVNGTIVKQEQSNEYGIYLFKPLIPGTYDLEILALGYDTARFNGIVVESKGMTYLDFHIASGVELPDFVVYASLIESDNPTIESKFDEEMIENMPVSSPIEVAVMAKQVQQNEQTGGLYIAGSREDATLYVVDGVKVIGSLYIPMKAIKEINVITGGIPANYGDVTGGIVEITTKSYNVIF